MTADLYMISGTAFVSLWTGFVLGYYFCRSRRVIETGTPMDGMLSIAYRQESQNYKLAVPWNAANVMLAQDRGVILCTSKGKANITQDPAIPYAYSAFDLSGEANACFVITDPETGDQWSTKESVTEFLKTVEAE